MSNTHFCLSSSGGAAPTPPMFFPFRGALPPHPRFSFFMWGGCPHTPVFLSFCGGAAPTLPFFFLFMGALPPHPRFSFFMWGRCPHTPVFLSFCGGAAPTPPFFFLFVGALPPTFLCSADFVPKRAVCPVQSLRWYSFWAQCPMHILQGMARLCSLPLQVHVQHILV